MKHYLSFFSFLLSLFMGDLQAVSGAWTSPATGAWDSPTNWTDPTFPNGAGESAGFVGLPTLSGTISSTTPITIGTITFDTLASLTLDFTANSLSFNGNPAVIFSTDSQTIGTGAGNTPVNLDTDLNLFIKALVTLTINSDISGSGNLSLFGGILNLTGSNSFTGFTFVNTGTLVLSGTPLTSTIPSDIFVFQQGTVSNGNDNQYNSLTIPPVNMNISGGTVFLNGTSQSLNSLNISDKGSLTNGGPGILTLNTNLQALTMSNNSSITINSLNLLNGGSIAYDNSIAGGVTITASSVQLNGNTVEINVPHNLGNSIDMTLFNTAFTNGTLRKTGDGLLKLINSTVTTFNIEAGSVLIEDNASTALGPVTIFSGANLFGRQNLIASQGVFNSGKVEPGNPTISSTNMGTLTIQGNYTQNSDGTLSIKALNAATADKLVVDGGLVSLTGSLFFEGLEGATFNSGDQIVILDNTNTGPAISGTFSSFSFNLPSCLTANLIYTPHQVIVSISSCSSPSPSAPCPPINFEGFLKKCHSHTCLLTATWTASPSADVTSYRIFKNGDLVKTISADSSLVFVDKHLNHCSVKGFEIAAVNSSNVESTRVPLVRVLVAGLIYAK